MELTTSYDRVFPQTVLDRYVLAETRNAAATLQGTNPEEFADLVEVLETFTLTLHMLTDAGRNKGEVARVLDLAFRDKGWRESRGTSETILRLTLEPYRAGGETEPEVRTFKSRDEGHKVDNVRGRVALDVEWNAKDGNLDRDLANFRALYDAAAIDVGIIITRHHERTKFAANRLAEDANLVRQTPTGQRIVLLQTTTTTNIEKLQPRLQRNAGGGCPILAVAITEQTYSPGVGEPPRPIFTTPVAIEGEPAADVETNEDGVDG